MTDRDNRRDRDQLHPSRSLAGECESDDDGWPEGKTPRAHHIRHATPPIVDPLADFNTDAGKWEWAKAMESRIADAEASVAACAAAERRRAKWRIWKYVGGGTSVGGVIMAGAFVVRALISAGEAANAARAETEALRDVVSRTRQIETQQAAHEALLDILTRTVFAPRP